MTITAFDQATETLIRRLTILNARSEITPSTKSCVQDALDCWRSAKDGEARGDAVEARRWAGAAVRWTDRAAQHEFGFALPEGW